MPTPFSRRQWSGVVLLALAILALSQSASGTTSPPSTGVHVASVQAGGSLLPSSVSPFGSPTTPPTVTYYNLTVVTHPSKCLIYVSLASYTNGTWNQSMTPGDHQIVAPLCPGEAFVSWSTTAGTLNSTNLTTALLDVVSNGTLVATYGFGYNVTFDETGLVLGTSWTVTLGPNPQTQSITQIVFGAANGTLHYQITPFQDYAAKYSGSVTVHGADVTVDVTFTSLLYTTSFSETGLPAETRWSVTYNGTRDFSVSSVINFAEVNGTYTFSIWNISGYSVNVTSGQVTVSGNTHEILLHFSPVTNSPQPLPIWVVYSIVGGVAGTVIVVGTVFLVYRKAKGP